MCLLKYHNQGVMITTISKVFIKKIEIKEIKENASSKYSRIRF